jgi:hypothetical protein
MTRIRIFAVTCLCVLMGMTPVSAAKGSGEFQEYEVKATFLYRLSSFVEWPEMEQDSRNLRLCVIGEDPFGALIDFFQGQIVHGRKLVITRLGEDSPLDSCNLAFVGTTETRREESLLAKARLAHVLTVGESKKFTRHGGIVRFFLDKGLVRMEINATAAKASGLSISAKLMSLVEVVHYPVEGDP